MIEREKKTAYPYITEFKKEPFESFAIMDRRKIGSFHLSNYSKITKLYQNRIETIKNDINLNLEHLYWFLLLGKYLKEDLANQKQFFYDFIKSCELEIIERDQIGFKSNPKSNLLPDIWSTYYALACLNILGLLDEYFSLKVKSDFIRKIKNFIYEHKKGEIFLHCLDKKCEIHKHPYTAETIFYILEILTILGSDVRLFGEQFRVYLSNRKKIPSMTFKFLAIKYLDLELDVRDKEVYYFNQFQMQDGGFSFSNEKGNINDTFWIIYIFNNFSWLVDYNPARIYSFLNQNIQKICEYSRLETLDLSTNLAKLVILLSFIWKKFIGEIERVIFKQIEKEGYIDIKQIKNSFGLTYGIEEIILYINLSYNFKLKIINNTIEFNNYIRTLGEGLKIVAIEINTQLRESSIICLSDILKNYKENHHLEPLKIKENVLPLIIDMVGKRFFEGSIRSKTRFLRKPKYYFYLDYMLDDIIISDMVINTEKLFEEKEKLSDIKNDIYNMTLTLKNISTQIKEEIESYLLLDEIEYAKERLRFILRNTLLEADFLNENIENSFSQDMKYINIQAVLVTEINQWKKIYSIIQKKLSQVEKYLNEKILEKEELKKFELILDELENRIFEIGEFIKKELDSFRKFFREELESGYNSNSYNLIKKEFKKVENHVLKYDNIIYRISQKVTIKDEPIFKKHKRIVENWVNLKRDFESTFNQYKEGFNYFDLTVEKIENIKAEIKNDFSNITQKANNEISLNNFQEAFETIRKDSELLLNQKTNNIKDLRGSVKNQIKENQKLYLLYQYLEEKLDELEPSIINLTAEQVESLKDNVIEERNRTKIEDFDGFISQQMQFFKLSLEEYKNKLNNAKNLRVNEVISGFDKILIELDNRNKLYLKKLNNIEALIPNFEQKSISIIQWEKFQDCLANEIKILKENYVNQIIINEIEKWTIEKNTNNVDLAKIANKVDLKCKAVISLIKEMIDFSKLEGDLDEERKTMIVHNNAFYKNKELNTFIETKLIKNHQQKIGKILALYDSGVRNKKLAVNILELENRINDYAEIENFVRMKYEKKVKELNIHENREENIKTRKELENILINGKNAIQKIKENLNFFNNFQSFISEEYDLLRVNFINTFIKFFEDLDKFESHIKAMEQFEARKVKFDIKSKELEDRINEKLKNALTKNSGFKRLETELREFYVAKKNEFSNFYDIKLNKIVEDINRLKDETYRNELLEKINKTKIYLSQLLGTLQTRVEDYIEYKEFKRANIKVQKRERKVELEIKEVSKNIKQIVKEYEKKSKNFQNKNMYLLEDFENFLKNFRELLTEKVKSLEELIVKAYVSMAIKAVAHQYLTISFLQNELNMKKQKIQEHLISLISSEKLKGKYNPQIGLYYEDPQIIEKLDESELEVMKKMNFRLYMFWKRLKSFTSQNYSIFTFLAAILSITISLSSVTGPSIYILLFILLVALALFLLIKRRKQNKI